MKALPLLFIGLGVAASGCKKPEVEAACQNSCTVITGRFVTDDGKTGIPFVPLVVPLKMQWV
jgi:hypothetical protein